MKVDKEDNPFIKEVELYNNQYSDKTFKFKRAELLKVKEVVLAPANLEALAIFRKEYRKSKGLNWVNFKSMKDKKRGELAVIVVFDNVKENKFEFEDLGNFRSGNGIE